MDEQTRELDLKLGEANVEIAALKIKLEAALVLNKTLNQLVPQVVQQVAGVAASPCVRHCEITAFKASKREIHKLARDALRNARTVRSEALTMNKAMHEASKETCVKLAQLLDVLGGEEV